MAAEKVTPRVRVARTQGRRKSDVWPALTKVLVHLATLLSVITSAILYQLSGQQVSDQAASAQITLQKLEAERIRREAAEREKLLIEKLDELRKQGEAKP